MDKETASDVGYASSLAAILCANVEMEPGGSREGQKKTYLTLILAVFAVDARWTLFLALEINSFQFITIIIYRFYYCLIDYKSFY